MIFIAHRGCIDGPNHSIENNPSAVERAISLGFNVEIDVWHFDDMGWFIGHDGPTYKVDFDFLDRPQLFLHCKNGSALSRFISNRCVSADFFWHQNDCFTLTSKSYIWTFPGKPLFKKSIALLLHGATYSKEQLKVASGICADNILEIKNQWS